jgi:ferredoxin--NADP+ reductase
LRVAVIGAGPAGFYAAQHLFADDSRAVSVDMFDRLPTPFGLVRHGVAPDHQKIKSVIGVYEKIARDPRFRFYGYVDFGRDLTLADLERHYHQIVFSTGAQTDRRLGIPGEDLAGSHSATDFVAWYNGHPDYADLSFDLDVEQVAVIGVGNVAVDVARILCRTPGELAETDIADHALDRLRAGRVRVVHLLGRRGPAQAAFTNPEIKELGELVDTATSTLADEVELDPASRAALDAEGDRATRRKVELLAGYAGRTEPHNAKRLVIRFLVSPVEILGDDRGRVRGLRIVRNELRPADDGTLVAQPTDRYETLDVGLVFRSVGYRGVALSGLPFDERRGVVPHARGRIVDPGTGRELPGLYVTGWIKRGPTGVIGTNKPDAAETVERMLEDEAAGDVLAPADPEPGAIERRLAERGVAFVTYDDWCAVDAREIALGKSLSRPRVKLCRHAEFRRALDEIRS